MKKAVTALKLAPGEPPSVVYLPLDLHALEYAVSEGAYYIGTLAWCPLSDGIGIIYNAEAALSGLPGNRKIGEQVYAGVVFLAKKSSDNKLLSLSHKEIAELWMAYAVPETYLDDELNDSYFSAMLDVAENK